MYISTVGSPMIYCMYNYTFTHHSILPTYMYIHVYTVCMYILCVTYHSIHVHVPTAEQWLTYVGFPEGLGVVALVEQVQSQSYIGHGLQHPVSIYQRFWTGTQDVNGNTHWQVYICVDEGSWGDAHWNTLSLFQMLFK